VKKNPSITERGGGDLGGEPRRKKQKSVQAPLAVNPHLSPKRKKPTEDGAQPVNFEECGH